MPADDHARGSLTGVVVRCALLLSIVLRPGVAQQSPPALGVSAGVYSEVQARRGEAQYRISCATCHGVDLRGGEQGKRLLGRAFRNSLLDRTVGDVYDTLRVTMPEDNPGALSRSAYIDLLAFLLEANGYPEGDAELPADSAALNKIRIDERPGGP